MYYFSDYQNMNSNNYWKYQKNEKCFIEIAINSENKEIKKFRVDTFRQKGSLLPKQKLSFEHIRRDAKKNDITPKYLVLVNVEKKIMENIDLRKEKDFSKKWFVPSIVDSYILYVHQFISKTTDKKIFIHNFLERGFPIKHVIDSKFLISIATQ